MSDDEVVSDPIEKILDRFDKLEKQLARLPDRAWTIEDCANFMQCSYTTAYRMSKQAGFPKPAKPQTNDRGSRMCDRYHPDEFKDWFYSRVNRAS